MERLIDLAASLWLPGLVGLVIAAWVPAIGPAFARRVRRTGGSVPLLALLVVTGPVVTMAHGLSDGELSGLLLRLSQAGTVVVVGAAGAALLGRGGLRMNRPVAVGIATFYGAALLGCAFGSVPGLPQAFWIAPLVLFAACMRDIDHAWVVKVAARCTAFLVVASLLAIVLVPNLAFDTSEERSLLGVDRLRGVAGHPNGLAALAVLALVLQLSARLRWRRPLIAASVVALALAQSRTGWVMFAVAILFLHPEAAEWPRWLRRSAGLGLAVAIAVAAFAPSAVGARIESVLNDDGTLNGRRQIWELALAEHRESPWFGYGPSLLNEEYRARHGASSATAAAQAHNQVVQTLGDSGYVGLFGLLVLALAWLAATRRMAGFTGLGAALMAQLIIRAITETPLRPVSPGNSQFYLLVVVSVLSSAGSTLHRGEPSKGYARAAL